MTLPIQHSGRPSGRRVAFVLCLATLTRKLKTKACFWAVRKAR